MTAVRDGLGHCVTLIIAVIVVAISLPTSTNLRSTLSNVFLSGDATPNNFTDRDHNNFMTNNTTLHDPIQGVGLITFSPPELSTKYNNVSLFNNSFSFVGTSRLITLFHRVTTGTINMTFGTTVSTVGPTLNGLVRSFRGGLRTLGRVVGGAYTITGSVIGSFASPNTQGRVTSATSATTRATGNTFSSLFSKFASLFDSPGAGGSGSAGSNDYRRYNGPI